MACCCLCAGCYLGIKCLPQGQAKSFIKGARAPQGGLSFELDASLRQRSRLQTAGLEGVEVFHYDGATDSPAWTERGTSWTRNIAGIGGELAAVQESGKEITLQYAQGKS